MRDLDTRDTIRLTGLSARGYHGVLAAERSEGQIFVADVVLRLAGAGVREAAAGDDLRRTVDYSQVAGAVVDVIEGEPVNLVETLASRIAQAVLERDVDQRIETVEVTVHKPQAPLEVAFDDVAVTIVRAADWSGTGAAGTDAAGTDGAGREGGGQARAVQAPRAWHGTHAAPAAMAPVPAPPAPEEAASSGREEPAPAQGQAEAPWWDPAAGAGQAAAEVVGVAAGGAGVTAGAVGEAAGLRAGEAAAVAAGVVSGAGLLAQEGAGLGISGQEADDVSPASAVEPPEPEPEPEPERQDEDAQEPTESAFVADGGVSDDAGETDGVVPLPEDEPAQAAEPAEVTGPAQDGEASEPAEDGADEDREDGQAPSAAVTPQPAVALQNPLEARPAGQATAVIALGGNVGGVVAALRQAVHTLSSTQGVSVQAVAPLARTAAVVPEGGESQPDYLNTVVLVTTTLSPRELLGVCQGLETDAGRVRLTPKGPRTLDADLITYEGVTSRDAELTLPHPRARERAFVLVPWAQADPFAEIGEESVASLAEQAPDRGGVRWLALDWLDSDHLPALPTGQYVAPPAAPGPEQAEPAPAPEGAPEPAAGDDAAAVSGDVSGDVAGAVVEGAVAYEPAPAPSEPEPAPSEPEPEAPAAGDAAGDGHPESPEVAEGTVSAEGDGLAAVAGDGLVSEPAPAAAAEPDEHLQPGAGPDSVPGAQPASGEPAVRSLALPQEEEREWAAPPSWGDVIGGAEADQDTTGR